MSSMCLLSRCLSHSNRRLNIFTSFRFAVPAVARTVYFRLLGSVHSIRRGNVSMSRLNEITQLIMRSEICSVSSFWNRARITEEKSPTVFLIRF